jgi:hypothetical protein
MREGFAAAIAGRGDTHQTGVETVLHVALQDAVLDQDRTLCRIALVVDVQRTTSLGEGAVIDDGDASRRDAAADATGKGRTSLAVEIALEAMTHRLVQQDARPAGTEDDGHRTRRRRPGDQIGHRLMDRLAGVAVQHIVGEKS